jgi:hypothetical protein
MSFWHDQTDPAAVRPKLDDVAVILYQMTGQQTDVVGYRVGAVLPNGVGVARRFVSGDYTFGIATGSKSSDFPTTAWLLKLLGSTGQYERITLRGVPDTSITTGGVFVPSDRDSTNLSKFYQALNANGFGIVYQDPAIQPKIVTGFDSTSGIVTCPAHGYPAGSRVKIARVKNIPGLNKIWAIIPSATTLDQFLIRGWTNTTAPIVGSFGKSYALLQSKTFATIQVPGEDTAWTDWVRSTEHRTGRPTALLSGRRIRRN